MSNNKILFTGPLGVGVTTAIRTISDIAPATHEVEHCNTNGDKISVKLDYGILNIETGDQIYLYGLPDKETIKPIHKTLSEDCIGVVLLVNNVETEPVACMLQNIEYFQNLVGKEAIAVGLTRYDDDPTPEINEFHVELRERKLNIPVFSVNVHEKNDVIILVKALLYNLDSGVS